LRHLALVKLCFIKVILYSMNSFQLSRRDFLKLGVASLGSLAFKRFLPNFGEFNDSEIVRVAAKSVSVYNQPDDTSLITGQHFRDEIVNIYQEVVAKTPGYNPIWYRVWGGYMHRARLQKVRIAYNIPLNAISEKGQLAEVTVPYTVTMQYNSYTGWQPLYRLYYTTTHWIVGIDEGPDKQPWYRLWDELMKINYHVQASHLRALPDEEWAPITPEIPFEKKLIKVDLSRQNLTAYENDQIVFETKISSGIPGLQSKNELPTETPRGKFNIQDKFPSKHMGDGNLASDIEAYELVGVPWTSFFTATGYAFHGTYWHDNFGVPMSHGCVNMRPAEAKWLFRWTRPAVTSSEFEVPGKVDFRDYGTKVEIF
jgi:lipoprotein-anchoring transpeptidase ErfK/SrfK